MRWSIGLLLLALAGAAALSGCGQKGDLYLPEDAPRPERAE